MRTAWTFTDQELDSLLAIYGAEMNREEGRISIHASNEKRPDDAVMERLLRKDFFEPRGTDHSLRVEEGLELSLMTICDPRTRITCSSSRSDQEVFGLFLHGDSIVVLEQAPSDGAFRLYWFPLITLALGTLYRFLREIMAGDSETDLFTVQCESTFPEGSDISAPEDRTFTIGRCGDAYQIAEEGKDLQILSRQEVFDTVNRICAYAHAASLKEILQERAS